MKKRAGHTLIEVLMALLVLAIVVPASLDALGGVFTASLKIQEKSYMISSAEWWLGRLEFPVRTADLNEAPQTDMYGKVSFEWEAEDLPDGAVMVTLRVYGRLPGPPFTVRRIF